MKIEKHTESLAIYQPKLDSIPEWNALSSKDQGELYEITMRGHQYRQLKMLGEFGELLELYRVQQLLDGKPMRMIDYLSGIYPDRARRTSTDTGGRHLATRPASRRTADFIEPADRLRVRAAPCSGCVKAP